MDTLAEVPRGSMNLRELKSRLEELYIKTAEFGARKELLENLINQNLTTRDVYHFIKNQAHLRLIDTRLDVIELIETSKDWKKSLGRH